MKLFITLFVHVNKSRSRSFSVSLIKGLELQGRRVWNLLNVLNMRNDLEIFQVRRRHLENLFIVAKHT
jgi:hypothetical protein